MPTSSPDNNVRTPHNLLPSRLTPGDKIALVCLSDPLVKDVQWERLRQGRAYLEAMGFKVEQGRYLTSEDPKEKVRDLHHFFARSDIKAVVSIKGGDSAHLCLPHIYWDIIEHHPKIFMGYSDLTVLINAIYHKTSLITFHGNDVCSGFGKAPAPYDRQEFLNRLVHGKTGDVPPAGVRKTVRGGKAAGRLLGGNLRCLLKLHETGCLPDFTAAVLMIESFRINWEQCRGYMYELEKMGILAAISGAIIGFVHGMQVERPQEKQMEDILCAMTGQYGFPILKVEDFGHFCPNTVLPIGAMVHIDADEKRIAIMEDVVGPRL